MEEYKIRYRHLDGDVGPLSFTEKSSVSDMKAAILENWPTEGAIAAKKPEDQSMLRVVYQGKTLDDTQTIVDLKRLPGEILPGSVVTLHLLTNAPGQVPGQGRTASKDTSSSTSCCCIQ